MAHLPHHFPFFVFENATNLVVLLTFKILKLEGFVVYSFCSFSNSPHPPTPQIYGSEACGNTSTMTENHNKALKMMATTLYWFHLQFVWKHISCLHRYWELQALKTMSMNEQWFHVQFVLFSIDLVHLDVDAPPYTVRKFQHFTYNRFSEVSDWVFGQALMCRVFRQVWWTGHIFKSFVFVEFLSDCHDYISMWVLHHLSFLLGLLPVTGLALRLPHWSA